MRKLNIGLTDEQREGVVKLLNHDLADAYLLLIKTKKYHWDVVGPQFRSLHELWQEQYEALTENIDSIAERARTLGVFHSVRQADLLKWRRLRKMQVMYRWLQRWLPIW